MNRHPFALLVLTLIGSSGLLGKSSTTAAPKLPVAVRHLYKHTASRPLYLYSLSPTGFAALSRQSYSSSAADGCLFDRLIR